MNRIYKTPIKSACKCLKLLSILELNYFFCYEYFLIIQNNPFLYLIRGLMIKACLNVQFELFLQYLTTKFYVLVIAIMSEMDT